MDEMSVVNNIHRTFPGVEATSAYGYTFFFYEFERMLPFATLIASDQNHDRHSNLDRPGVFRLNIGASRQTFQALFGTAKVDVSGYDFTALDVIMPHPEYAQQNFICVLSPGDSTAEQVGALLTEAYEIAVRRYTRQKKNAGAGSDSG
jgi:uncharacterized protein DUF6194